MHSITFVITTSSDNDDILCIKFITAGLKKTSLLNDAINDFLAYFITPTRARFQAVNAKTTIN